MNILVRRRERTRVKVVSVFPVEQIVYVPCLRKVIAPNKLVSAGDEMKDVLRVRDRPTCTRLDIAECESKVELAVGCQQWEG